MSMTKVTNYMKRYLAWQDTNLQQEKGYTCIRISLESHNSPELHKKIPIDFLIVQFFCYMVCLILGPNYLILYYSLRCSFVTKGFYKNFA